MSNQKVYGPWIKWHGGECPVPPDTLVKIKMRDGVVLGPGYAASFLWRQGHGTGDIVEYCVAVDQADLEAAEKLLRENGYTVTPPAKPLTFDDVTPMTEAPKKGTWYWVIQPFNSRGVEAFAWGGDEYDLAALRHRMAYIEREHALIAAQYIFGLNGGEMIRNAYAAPTTAAQGVNA